MKIEKSSMIALFTFFSIDVRVVDEVPKKDFLPVMIFLFYNNMMRNGVTYIYNLYRSVKNVTNKLIQAK